MAYVIPVLVYISAAFNTKYDVNSNIRPDIPFSVPCPAPSGRGLYLELTTIKSGLCIVTY